MLLYFSTKLGIHLSQMWFWSLCIPVFSPSPLNTGKLKMTRNWKCFQKRFWNTEKKEREKKHVLFSHIRIQLSNYLEYFIQIPQIFFQSVLNNFFYGRLNSQNHIAPLSLFPLLQGFGKQRTWEITDLTNSFIKVSCLNVNSLNSH